MHILEVRGSIGNHNIVAVIQREGNVCIRSLIICIPQVLIHIVVVYASTENDNIVGLNWQIIFVSYHQLSIIWIAQLLFALHWYILLALQ